MNFSNFGREHLNNGSLNNMLEQVGIDDVGSFVNQFRNHAAASTGQSNEFASGEGSFGNQSTRGHGGNNYGDMIQGAMNAYRTFSGGHGNSGGGSGGGGGGGFMDNMGSTIQSAQQMHALYKQFDKNGDGKITAEDIQIYLQELGLGSVSPYLAKALFQAVDQNHNGSLDFTDLMALTTMISRLSGQFGGGAGGAGIRE